MKTLVLVVLLGVAVVLMVEGRQPRGHHRGHHGHRRPHPVKTNCTKTGDVDDVDVGNSTTTMPVIVSQVNTASLLLQTYLYDSIYKCYCLQFFKSNFIIAKNENCIYRNRKRNGNIKFRCILNTSLCKWSFEKVHGRTKRSRIVRRFDLKHYYWCTLDVTIFTMLHVFKIELGCSKRLIFKFFLQQNALFRYKIYVNTFKIWQTFWRCWLCEP